MAKGDIIINELLCKGCGLCVEFCPKKCIIISKEKLNPRGYLVAALAHPEKCNGCGACGWMCPDIAIEVYKYVEGKAPSATRR